MRSSFAGYGSAFVALARSYRQETAPATALDQLLLIAQSDIAGEAEVCSRLRVAAFREDGRRSRRRSRAHERHRSAYSRLSSLTWFARRQLDQNESISSPPGSKPVNKRERLRDW